MISSPTVLDSELPLNNIENFMYHTTSILLGIHPFFITNKNYDQCEQNTIDQIFSFCVKNKEVAIEFSNAIDNSNDKYLREISPNLHPDYTRKISTLIKESIVILKKSYMPSTIKDEK